MRAAVVGEVEVQPRLIELGLGSAIGVGVSWLRGGRPMDRSAAGSGGQRRAAAGSGGQRRAAAGSGGQRRAAAGSGGQRRAAAGSGGRRRAVADSGEVSEA
eukprot:jgi/Ulvmu1/514/UM001_0522.1